MSRIASPPASRVGGGPQLRPGSLTIRLLRCLTLFGALFTLTCPAVAADIEGQRPVLLLGETFQFVPGAWASYRIHDKARDEHYRTWIATLEKQPVDDQPASWMEIVISSRSLGRPKNDLATTGVQPTLTDTPPVVTRLHVRETPQGPGEILNVIVQLLGHAPFTVPKRYYTAKDREVGDFQTVRSIDRIDRRGIRLGDRELVVTVVEGLDPNGKRMTATVSEAVPPIGVVSAETESISMQLDDWGMQARSKIDGKPTNFYLWLLKEIGQEVIR